MPLPPVPDLGEIRFQKDRDAGDVLNATIALLRQNAREVFVGFFAIVTPVALAAGVAGALYFSRMGDLFVDPVAMQDPDAVLGLFGPAYFGLLAFGFLSGVVAQAAAGAYVRLYRSGEAGEVSVGVLWEETKDLVLPVAGFNLALFGGMIGSFLLLVIPCLGAIAWLALLVWATPYAVVTLAARLTESPSLMAAWERARVLVKGSWAAAFWPIVLSAVVAYVVVLALSIPLYVVMVMVSANSVAADPAGIIGVMGAVLAPLQVLSMGVYLVPLVAIFFVHGKLVEDLEGTSLRDDLDALADPSAATRWDDAPASTSAPDAPRSTPPASGSDDATPDDARGGFRGGGFGGEGR